MGFKGVPGGLVNFRRFSGEFQMRYNKLQSALIGPRRVLGALSDFRGALVSCQMHFDAVQCVSGYFRKVL